MMNKDNYWLQRDGSSAIKNPPPTGRRRLFSPLHATKAGIHSRYQ